MNAKQEFMRHVENRKITYAFILKDEGYRYDSKKRPQPHELKEGFTSDDYLSFVESLDFTYDEGFGSQELFGYILFKDGAWMERHEYDGSEVWEYKSSPKIEFISKAVYEQVL